MDINISPKAEVLFTRLNKPGETSGEFDIVVKIDQSNPEHQQLLEGIRKLIPEGGNSPIKEVNGETRVRFASKQVPAIFDANHDEIDSTQARPGSTVEVAYKNYVYEGHSGGLKLLLEAVVVHDAAPKRTADEYGFKKQLNPVVAVDF
jgi:hypothetical protein